MDNLSNRDKIRFAEIFDDPTLMKADMKDYMMVQKREYNPELSVFSNFVLDLVDFKDRVRPLAKDIALMDVTRQHQKHSIKDLEQEREELRQTIEMVESEVDRNLVEEGYSSRELEESSRDSARK